MTEADQRIKFEKALDTTPVAAPLPFDAAGDAGESQALKTVLKFKNAKADGRLRKALPL